MASYGDLAFVTRNDQKTIKGCEFPVLHTNTGGTFSNNFNLNAVKDGLIQLLLTNRGERPMRLDFGTNLRKAVFSPLDARTISELKQTIASAIKKYEDRVVLTRFEIDPIAEKSEVRIILVYHLKTDVLNSETLDLTINQKRVLING
jgi:hypothetical protein